VSLRTDLDVSVNRKKQTEIYDSRQTSPTAVKLITLKYTFIRSHKLYFHLYFDKNPPYRKMFLSEFANLIEFFISCNEPIFDRFSEAYEV
jgi:hypothetical protein